MIVKLLSTLKVYFFGSSSQRLWLYYRLAKKFHKKNIFIKKMFDKKIERNFGCYISSDAIIPLSVEFRHPNGIVIGKGAEVGENVVIYQQVTLGGARLGDWQDLKFPKIGDNTTIFAGAKILGDVTIGKNCIIGANAVVNRSIPDNSIAVGVPAKVVKTVVQ